MPLDNVVDFVDEVVAAMTITKDSSDPFADSDMIGNGAHADIEYLVEDEGIKVFALSQTFNLTELSRRAVYVYRNGEQLIHGADYTFDGTFGFIRLSLTLVEGDQIVIREYVGTGYNEQIIIIPDGNYDAAALATLLTTTINTTMGSGIRFTVTIDPNTYRTTITNSTNLFEMYIKINDMPIGY